MHFTAGVGFFDFDSLNSRFSGQGFSKLDQPTLLLGGGGEVRFWRFLMGAEGNWLRNLGSESERDDFRADVRGGYWLFRTGFDIVQWRGLSIYPLLGIGSGHMKVRIESEQGASFDDVLQNPGRSVEMRQDALLLDASLGVDYRFKVHENDTGASYFTIGVRGGYLFAPYNDGWDTGGAEISGGPDAGLSGPTVQIMLGISRSGPADCKRCGR